MHPLMPGGCKFNDYPTQKTIGCILMGRADAPELSVWHRYQSFLGYDVIIRLRMLMYGKEASNRKQEIDRQHYTIPNQRPKDKHFGKI